MNRSEWEKQQDVVQEVDGIPTCLYCGAIGPIMDVRNENSEGSMITKGEEVCDSCHSKWLF